MPTFCRCGAHFSRGESRVLFLLQFRRGVAGFPPPPPRSRCHASTTRKIFPGKGSRRKRWLHTHCDERGRKALRETLTDGFPPHPSPTLPPSPLPSHPILPLPQPPSHATPPILFFLSPPSTQPLLPRAPKMIIRNRRKRVGWVGPTEERGRIGSL